MNKKGFTLVELLAVILILSLLALLASTSITNVVRNSKSDLYNSQIKMIELAAETWGSENIELLPNNDECKYITLSNLKKYGLIDSNLINPKTNKKFSDNIKIKISAQATENGTLNFIYNVNSNDIKSCERAIETITFDDICEYQNNGVAEKTAGAKYLCEVKPGTIYNFYVLTTPNEGDTTINLIMDQNINSDGTPAGMKGVTQTSNPLKYNLVSWISYSDYGCAEQYCVSNNKGPVTAMTYLHNATKGWTNIDPVNYTYNDRIVQNSIEGEGYISFSSTNGIATITPLSGDSITIGTTEEPLRARMPIYSNDITITEVTNKTNAPYLYDNLYSADWNTETKGYWTLSSFNDSFGVAWYVSHDGTVDFHAGSVFVNDNHSVRPVISLKQ